MSAIDPANPYGAVIPGCGIAREAGNVVVIRAGRVIAGLQGRAMISGGEGGASTTRVSARRSQR